MRFYQSLYVFSSLMLGNDAIITHGYVKKKNKTDKTEIERAKSLKARFFKEEDDDGSIH